MSRWRGAFFIYFVIYVCVRAWVVGQSSYWSEWAYGDAQMLNAGRNFAVDGFLFHYFLPLTNPGFIHDFIYNNQPHGHYTHYPDLHTILLGCLAKLTADQDTYFWIAKEVFAAFSFASLILYFRLVSAIFANEAIAFCSAVIFSLTPVFCGYTASLCDQSLGLLLFAGYFVVQYNLCFRPGARYQLPLLFGISLLSGLNSLEYFPIFGMMALFCYGLNRRFVPLFLVCVATALSIALHFAQSWWAFGSWAQMSEHMRATMEHKINGGAFYGVFLDAVTTQVPILYAFLFMAGLGLVFELRKGLEAKIWDRKILFCWLWVAAAFSLYAVLPQQSYMMIDYSYRHVLLPLLPLSLFYFGRFMRAPVPGFFVPIKWGWAFVLLLAVGFLVLSEQNEILPLSTYSRPGSLDGPYHWMFQPKAGEHLLQLEEPLRWVQRQTKWGDIVVIPALANGNTAFEVNPIAEFFAQRHLIPSTFDMDSTDSIAELLRKYRATLGGLEPRIPLSRLFFLTDLVTGAKFGGQSTNCFNDKFCLYELSL